MWDNKSEKTHERRQKSRKKKYSPSPYSLQKLPCPYTRYLLRGPPVPGGRESGGKSEVKVHGSPWGDPRGAVALGQGWCSFCHTALRIGASPVVVGSGEPLRSFGALTKKSLRTAHHQGQRAWFMFWGKKHFSKGFFQRKLLFLTVQEPSNLLPLVALL